MGAGGSIPADEAAAKEAGKTDDEIAIYKFCVGLQDGSTKEVSAEGYPIFSEEEFGAGCSGVAWAAGGCARRCWPGRTTRAPRACG